MNGSGRSARRAGHRSRLGTLGVVLLPLLLAALPRAAHADIVCHDGTCTMDRERAVQCGVDARLVLEQAAELRDRLGDVHELRGLVERTSVRLRLAESELAAARAWWRSPWVGLVLGVVGTGAVAFALAVGLN